ncbi:MAG: metal-dependent hydrolase [Sphingobium sp.]|nr:metal-dependent hydrolase [Sphingobium sp.]
MDNFTHSLAGWALGQAGLKSKSRKGLAALILGANMPDIDVFFGWVPWAPLATHRGFTHGIGGILLMPALLAGLLWLLDRWHVSRGKPFPSGLPMHVPWLVALCYIGALTHPLLDLQTTYSVQLLSPFSTLWFHTETLFIIDVWLWSALAFAIWMSRRRQGRGEADWIKPAMVGLAAAGAYVALNGAISLNARAILLRSLPPGRAPDVIIAGEQPVLFWRRDLIWREKGAFGRASYDPFRSFTHVADIQPMVPDNMRDPLVRRAVQADPGIAAFMRWSFMPYAVIKREACQAEVSVGDARFGIQMGRGPLRRVVTLPLDGPECGPHRTN